MPIGDAVPSYTQASILEWLQNDLNTLRPDQYIIFVHHRPATGQALHQINLGAPIISTVVIDENSLLSGADYAGNVYAFYL